MAQVKLPQITVELNATYDKVTNEDSQWNQVNPSCLLAYLGIRGYANLSGVTSKTATKNAVPILAYYDIFKNFYANTQEDDFYIIGATAQLKGIRHENGTNPLPIPLPVNYILHNGQKYQINDVEENETGDNIIFRWQEPTGGAITESKLNELSNGDEGVTNGVISFTVNLANIGVSGDTIIVYSIQSTNSTKLQNIPLENLDTIRDKILLTPGDTVFNIASKSASVEPFNSFTNRLTANNLYSTVPQFGLCLKTYNSDLYQNWINTEWIDGVDGINEASAVDVSDGTLSMDDLNLS